MGRGSEVPTSISILGFCFHIALASVIIFIIIIFISSGSITNMGDFVLNITLKEWILQIGFFIYAFSSILHN